MADTVQQRQKSSLQKLKTSDRSKKHKGPWENTDLLNRVNTLIKNEKILVKHEKVSDAFREIATIISKEFGSFLKEKGLQFTATTVSRKINELIWTKDVDLALQTVTGNFQSPKKHFMPLYPYIHPSLVEKRYRWFRGVSNTTTRSQDVVAGIGRVRPSEELGDLSKVTLPENSFEKPFDIPLKNKNGTWSISFHNGANFGVRYRGNIVENVARRALSDAEHHEDDAVILTNLISLDLKKAGGPKKIGRALAMGDNINPEIFADEEYRDSVKEIMEKKPHDRIVYQTNEETLDNILAGWKKVCVKPNKKPEFPGPVLIVLGIHEEDLIKNIAYWEIHYWTKLQQVKYEAEKKSLKNALARAQKDGDYQLARNLENELKKVIKLLARTVVTNVASEESRRFYENACAQVIRRLEMTIPNSKVIGQGTTYVRIGEKIIEIHISSHETVTPSLLKNYAGNYGPKNLREKLAHAVVICHPWSLNNRMTIREADYNGVRGDAHIYVAPIIVDENYIREALRAKVSHDHPIMKVVFNDQAKTGMLRLSSTNGVISSDTVWTEALDGYKHYRDKKKNGGGTRIGRNADPRFYEDQSKYIWVHTSTDQHFGGRAKEFVTCKETGQRLGMAEAVFYMLRKAELCTKDKMPIHLFSTNDDESQAQNFKARTEPHPHQQSFRQIEQDYLNALKEARKINDPVRLQQMIEKVGTMFLYEMEKRGSDFLLEQMEQVLERHIDPNIDVFNAILGSAERAKIKIKGVGQFGNAARGGFDTRNPGIINFGSGNHFKHTVEGELVEGPFYANHLRNRLSALPDWKNKEQLLKAYVVAPLYGGQMIAWGTIKAGDGYEYGLDLRASPCRMGSWADPLFGAVSNDPQRGNYSRIFNGRLALKTYGDKHFFGLVVTGYAIYHMCASGTHTDAYGEHGFPPNNTGVSFVGLPVDGPRSGPILLRILTYSTIRDFVETNPRPFNWEQFLPNPA